MDQFGAFRLSLRACDDILGGYLGGGEVCGKACQNRQPIACGRIIEQACRNRADERSDRDIGRRQETTDGASCADQRRRARRVHTEVESKGTK
jgi:hypothetical protein